MADITSTWGLDYTEFKRGTQGVEREAARASARASHEFRQTQRSIMDVGKALLGMGLAGSAMRFAGDSMATYRKSVGETENQVTALSLAVGRMKTNIGEGLSMFADGGNGGMGGTVDTLEQIRGGIELVYAGMARAPLKLLYSDLRGPGEPIEDAYGATAGERASKMASYKLNELAKRQGEISATERRSRGGPDAESDAAFIEEKFRHRDALAKASAEQDATVRAAATESENKLNAAKIAGLQRERAEREDDKKLAAEIMELDKAALAVDDLRLNHKEAEAVFLEKDLAMKKEIARIEHDRSLSSEERSKKRQDTISIGSIGRDIAVAKVQAAERDAHRNAAQGIRDELEQAKIQRMQIDGHQTAAELAGIRLDYEQKIRQAMQDQNLSAAEQADAARRLGSARDSILRAAADEAVDKATGEYRSAIAGRSFRTLQSGAGPEAARGVFGPNGVISSGSTQSPEVVKKLDLLNKAVQAAGDVLHRIERNTQTPVATVGP